LAYFETERVSKDKANEEAWIDESDKGWKTLIVFSLLRLDVWRLEKGYLDRWNIG